jgi:hypothetical protein
MAWRVLRTSTATWTVVAAGWAAGATAAELALDAASTADWSSRGDRGCGPLPERLAVKMSAQIVAASPWRKG